MLNITQQIDPETSSIFLNISGKMQFIAVASQIANVRKWQMEEINLKEEVYKEIQSQTNCKTPRAIRGFILT